jgi:hypothetical protein
MQDEHWEAAIKLMALQDSATRVWDLVLKGSNEVSSLVASLSSATDLNKGRVDAAAANGVHWGARLVLHAALSHFPELEPELELLGSGYNADKMEGQLDAFWAWTRWALESLSSRVPPSTTHSPPDDTREE